LKEAEAMCALFTREGVPAMDNLNEMQCMWFQSECARGYQRTGQFGEALKKCYEIDRHFTEIVEDQFDFHTYCMRKMTLKSYVTLLRLEDELRSHKFYGKAAEVAIQTLVRLYDKPIKDIDIEEEIKAENLDPAEMRKKLTKAKKAKKKAELEEELKRAQEKKEALKRKMKRKGGDDDCDNQIKEELVPNKLERTETPLDEAAKFLEPLQFLVSKSVKTHLLAFEIYFRKGKPLLMLQAIKKAISLDASSEQLHSCLVRFLHYIEVNKATLNPTTIKVLETSMPEQLNNTTAAKLNDSFLAENSGDLKSLFIGCSLQVNMEQSATKAAVSKLMEAPLTGATYSVAKSILDAFQNEDFGDAGKESAEIFKKKCAESLPLARCFMEVQELEKKVEEKKGEENNHIDSTLTTQMDGITLNDKPENA